MVGVVRGFGEAVGVDQLDVRHRGEPALCQLGFERFAGHRHAAQIRQRDRVLVHSGQNDLEVGRHDLQHRNPAAAEPVHEAVGVQDHVLFDQQRGPADQQRGDQLPQGDVEALRRDLRHHRLLGDAEVVDLGVEMVDHPGVLAHRALRLAGGARGEVDVGELAGFDGDAEIVFGMVLLVRGVHEQRAHAGQRFDRLAQGRRAAGFGQHQFAVGPAQRGRDAVGREMRLDRQVDTARLEHGEHGGHPVQIAFGDHRDDALAAQPARDQRPRQAVGAPVELPVRPPPVAVHRGDRVRIPGGVALEQFVAPQVRHLDVRPGEPFQLQLELRRRQQGRFLVRCGAVGADQAERAQVVAEDAFGRFGIQHLGAEAQPERLQIRRNVQPQHDVPGEVPVGAGRVEDRFERRRDDAEFGTQFVDREVPEGEGLRVDRRGVLDQLAPGAGFGAEPAGQRRPARLGDVAGAHLGLARQRGEDLGVRGEQH